MPKTLSEREVIEEALDVLLKHMEPAKVAKFLAVWQTDGQNYLDVRDQLFSGVTVEELYKRLREFEATR